MRSDGSVAFSFSCPRNLSAGSESGSKKAKGSLVYVETCRGQGEAVPRIGGQDRDRLGSRQTEPNCQKLERLEKPSETRCGRRERYVPLVSYLRKVSNLTKKLYMDICFTAVIYSLWINYVCVDIYIPKCIFLHTLCVCALT